MTDPRDGEDELILRTDGGERLRRLLPGDAAKEGRR
jgi:hypothetical protein